jgi:hypothetical protein
LWKKIYATHLILSYRLLETIQRSEDTGEKRNPYRILVGRLEGQRPSRRPRLRRGVILNWMRKE